MEIAYGKYHLQYSQIVVVCRGIMCVDGFDDMIKQHHPTSTQNLMEDLQWSVGVTEIHNAKTAALFETIPALRRYCDSCTSEESIAFFVQSAWSVYAFTWGARFREMFNKIRDAVIAEHVLGLPQDTPGLFWGPVGRWGWFVAVDNVDIHQNWTSSWGNS